MASTTRIPSHWRVHGRNAPYRRMDLLRQRISQGAAVAAFSIRIIFSSALNVAAKIATTSTQSEGRVASPDLESEPSNKLEKSRMHEQDASDGLIHIHRSEWRHHRLKDQKCGALTIAG